MSYLPVASSCWETGTGGLSVSLWGAKWGDGERCPSMLGGVRWAGDSGRGGGGGGGKEGGGRGMVSSWVSSSLFGPLLCSGSFQDTGAWIGVSLMGEWETQVSPHEVKRGAAASGHLYLSRRVGGGLGEIEPLFFAFEGGSVRMLRSGKCWEGPAGCGGDLRVNGGSETFLSNSPPVKSGAGSWFGLGNKSLYPPSLNLRENMYRYISTCTPAVQKHKMLKLWMRLCFLMHKASLCAV